jgi:hypothetical protein
METQFAAGTLAVQVVVLVQPDVSLEDAPLRETLSAVLAAPVARRVLALGRVGGDWLPAGFDLMGQRGGDYGERAAAAFADAGRLLLDRLASAGLRVALAPRLEVAGAALRF